MVWSLGLDTFIITCFFILHNTHLHYAENKTRIWANKHIAPVSTYTELIICSKYNFVMFITFKIITRPLTWKYSCDCTNLLFWIYIILRFQNISTLQVNVREIIFILLYYNICTIDLWMYYTLCMPLKKLTVIFMFGT